MGFQSGLLSVVPEVGPDAAGRDPAGHAEGGAGHDRRSGPLQTAPVLVPLFSRLLRTFEFHHHAGLGGVNLFLSPLETLRSCTISLLYVCSCSALLIGERVVAEGFGGLLPSIVNEVCTIE